MDGKFIQQQQQQNIHHSALVGAVPKNDNTSGTTHCMPEASPGTAPPPTLSLAATAPMTWPELEDTTWPELTDPVEQQLQSVPPPTLSPSQPLPLTTLTARQVQMDALRAEARRSGRRNSGRRNSKNLACGSCGGETGSTAAGPIDGGPSTTATPSAVTSSSIVAASSSTAIAGSSSTAIAASSSTAVASSTTTTAISAGKMAANAAAASFMLNREKAGGIVEMPTARSLPPPPASGSTGRLMPLAHDRLGLADDQSYPPAGEALLHLPYCPRCYDVSLVLEAFGGVCYHCHACVPFVHARRKQEQERARAARHAELEVQKAAQKAAETERGERQRRSAAAVKLQARARGHLARKAHYEHAGGNLVLSTSRKLLRTPSRKVHQLFRASSAYLENVASMLSDRSAGNLVEHPGRQSRLSASVELHLTPRGESGAQTDRHYRPRHSGHTR